MEKITIVPETAHRPDRIPNREQRLAQQAAERETTAIEQHPDVIAALEAHGKAEEELAALEERILDGDPKVTARDTGHAREVAHVARLRVAAARRRIRDQRQADRDQARQDAIAGTRQALTQTYGPDALEALRATAETALADYLRAVAAHNQTIKDGYRQLQQAGVPAYDASYQADKAGAQHAAIRWDTVRIDGRDHTTKDYVQAANAVVEPAANAANVKAPDGRQIRAQAYIR